MGRSSRRAGLSLALLSAATFGTSGSFADSLLAAGWTPLAAVTVRVVLAALVLTVPALLALRGRFALLRRGTATTLVYGVAAVAGAQLCYFNAVQHLSVAVALLLEYSGILLVVAWMWLRHGQHPRRLTALGAVAAVAGLVLVLNLIGNAHLDLVGVLWGLGAAGGLAAYFVLSASTDDPLPPVVAAWQGLVVGGAVLVLAGVLDVQPLAAPRAQVVLLGDHVSWLVPVLGLSMIAAVVAYLTGIAGARLLGARAASFVGLTEVLFAVLFAWVLLGQDLTPVQLAGGLLVVAGVALVQLDEVQLDEVQLDEVQLDEVQLAEVQSDEVQLDEPGPATESDAVTVSAPAASSSARTGEPVAY